MNHLLRRARGAVKRERAENYLLLMLLSFAGSVTVTRLFLELTGYPQIGNRELHIAHVLWGGLLLFVAALLPLIIANRWAYTVGALTGGIGVGLFIDEVGKFITRNNDYFYPFAAPIIYAFFLLTVLLYLRVRRPASAEPRAELYRALDALMEVLEHDLDPAERDDLEGRLARVAARTDDPDLASLAAALRDFVRFGSIHLVPDRPSLWERLRQRGERLERWLGRGRARTLLAAGMIAFSLLACLRLGVSLLALFQPSLLEQIAREALAGEQFVRSATSLTWYVVQMVLEGLVGVFLLVGGLLLLARRERPGTWISFYGLLVALTMVNLLVFYFAQFSTIVVSLAQFALLLGLLRYRRRYLTAPDD